MTSPKPRAPIELRTVTVDDVRFPERIIDLVAVPYDQWAPVEYQGRIIEEQFAPGAFGHVGNRASKFLVNLEHDPDRVVGRVVKLDPDSPDGLRTEIFVRRGPDFDQVLDDAADGMLDGSVGFGAYPENQEWPRKDRRRIVKAFLDHIALTFTPAYRGANVVAVRSQLPSTMTATATATPNLDRVLAERLAASYGLRE